MGLLFLVLVGLFLAGLQCGLEVSDSFSESLAELWDLVDPENEYNYDQNNQQLWHTYRSHIESPSFGPLWARLKRT
jgi:hypothetical protein